MNRLFSDREKGHFSVSSTGLLILGQAVVYSIISVGSDEGVTIRLWALQRRLARGRELGFGADEGDIFGVKLRC